MQYIQEITLDLYQPNYVYVYAKQGDADARFLRIHLTANGVEFKPDTGVSAAFRALKSDGKSIDNPSVIEAGGTILACLTDQTLAVSGEVTADIVLKKGTEVISTLNFVIVVQPAPQGADLPSTNELGEMIQATADAVAAAESANTAAGKANTAAQGANTATEAANEAAALLEGMTVTVSDVEPGGKATAALTKQGDHYNLALGLVKGDTGPVSSVNGGTGNVVIGGKNLISNKSELIHLFQHYKEFSSLTKTADGLVINIIKYVPVEQALSVRLRNLGFNGIGGAYTLSFFAVSSAPCSLLVDLTDTEETEINIDTSAKKYIITHVFRGNEPYIQSNNINGFVDFTKPLNSEINEGITITISDLKLERGNVPTDWSPAPEDKADVPLQFDVSLPASGWVNGSQTVTDARFVAGDNIDWDVDVKGSCIPWNGITITEGQMVAKADIVPTTDMTWTATRREVRRDE